MAKIVIDCADPNDFAQVVESAEKAAGSCTVTYAKQHLEMVEVGTSGSIRESSRIIAEDSDETPKAVEHKIHRGLDGLPHDGAEESKPEEDVDIIPKLKGDSRGGKREGCGRKREIKSWNNYYTEFINLILKAHEPLKKLTEQPEWELNKHHVIEDIKRLTLIGGC